MTWSAPFHTTFQMESDGSLKLGVPTDVGDTDLKKAYRKQAIKVRNLIYSNIKIQLFHIV